MLCFTNKKNKADFVEVFFFFLFQFCCFWWHLTSYLFFKCVIALFLDHILSFCLQMCYKQTAFVSFADAEWVGPKHIKGIKQWWVKCSSETRGSSCKPMLTGLCLVLSHSRAGRRLGAYVPGGLCLQGGARPCQQSHAAVFGGTEEE